MQILIKECFTNVKQVFLLCRWGSLVTLELISLIPRSEPPNCEAPRQPTMYVFISLKYDTLINEKNF